jgi:hypothetical protein
MIRLDAELHGETSFREWASLFSEGLFVMLQFFADESGRMHPEVLSRGDLNPVVCGYIDTPHNWEIFRRKWTKTLSDHRAEYFHFREFATKELYTKPGKAYYGWSKKKRHKFLYDLAFLCSESAVPEGTVFDVRNHLSSLSTDNPIETSLVNFFKSFRIGMDRHFRGFDGKVLFIFDKCKDKDWIVPIHKVHSEFSDLDPRIGGLTFEDDEDSKFCPLQAADLLAYSFHQNMIKFMAGDKKGGPPLRSLDFILQRNLEPKLRQLDNNAWRATIDCMREDEKTFMKQNPGLKYNPAEHFKIQTYVTKYKKLRGV